MSTLQWVSSLSLILVGCAVNVVLLEVLVREAPGCSNLVTFSQFLFVAVDGFLQHIQYVPEKEVAWLPVRLKPRRIPLSAWIWVVIFFYSSSVLNNLALNFHVSVPTQIIFRSGSLCISMLFGVIFLKRTYSIPQIVSVIVVTLGVILFTLSSTKDANIQDADVVFYEWVFGVLILIVALLLTCYLGILQEYTYTTYGRFPDEGMFYVHLLSLPFFLLFSKSISDACNVFNASSPLGGVQLFGIGLPRLWAYLSLNMVTQYLCVRGVYTLTSITTSLTVQLVLAIRKTLSLLISVVLFSNPFGLQQAIGAILVFGGTVIYTATEQKTKTKNDVTTAK